MIVEGSRPAFSKFVQILMVVLPLALLGGNSSWANSKYAGIVVDAKTGKTLYSSSANSRRYPASLTKIMTLYVLFEEIERGRFSLDSRLKVSKFAAGQAPSKLGLKAGSTIRVRNAIRALAVKSANDVAVVVAENISGSESAFARRMTQTARSLGMTKTTFRNASGLPNAKQITTARDMAILGRAIQDRFPSHYKYFSTRSFTWGERKYSNTNRLLGRVNGVDGIKTGYTRASGFNLVTSVRRNDRHIVAVVMGGRTSKRRNAHMEDLIRRYLHKAKRGKRSAPPILGSEGYNIPPLPRARPAAISPREPIPIANSPDPGLPTVTKSVTSRSLPSDAGTASTVAASQPHRPADRISERINSASQAAVMAYRAGALSQPGLVKGFSTPEQGGKSIAAPQEAIQSVSDGWYVQIAAVPTESGAKSVLDAARRKAPEVLGSVKPITQMVKKGKKTYFRARFAGFADKYEARRVCKTLKRLEVNCLAVPH